MTPVRNLVIETINNIVGFAFIYGIFAVPMYLTAGDRADLWRLMIIALPFLGNFALRRLVKKIWPGIWVHVLLTALAFFFAPALMHRAIWFAAVAVMAVYSIRHYFVSKPSTGFEYITFSALIFIALGLWAALGGHWTLTALFSVILVIIVTGQILVLHMAQMDISLDAAGRTSSQPIKRIIAFDYKLVAGLGVTIALLTLLIYIAVTGPVTGLLAGLLPDRWDFAVPEGNGMEAYTLFSPERDSPELYERDFTEPSAFARIFELFFHALSSAIAIGAALFIFIFFAKALFRWLNRRAGRVGESGANLSGEDERIFVLPKLARNKRRRPDRNEHPVRRLFRETVRRHIKFGASIKKSDTPTEIAARIQTQDISGLAEEYAGVRYK